MSNLPENVQTRWNVQIFCLLTLTLIALGAALYFLRPVLVPFVLAVFLTNCLMPVIAIQQRYLRAPQSVAIATTMVLALVILALGGALDDGLADAIDHIEPLIAFLVTIVRPAF